MAKRQAASGGSGGSQDPTIQAINQVLELISIDVESQKGGGKAMKGVAAARGNCFGTAGTFGTAGGCFGTFGSYGCLAKADDSGGGGVASA